MFQEDGMLRYIEGVETGDGPAHDGSYEVPGKEIKRRSCKSLRFALFKGTWQTLFYSYPSIASKAYGEVNAELNGAE